MAAPADMGSVGWVAFEVLKARAADRTLVGGAALFGVGWGLAGYCPGPAVAGLAVGSTEALWFVSAMLAGSAIYGWISALETDGKPAANQSRS